MAVAHDCLGVRDGSLFFCAVARVPNRVALAIRILDLLLGRGRGLSAAAV